MQDKNAFLFKMNPLVVKVFLYKNNFYNAKVSFIFFRGGVWGAVIYVMEFFDFYVIIIL